MAVKIKFVSDFLCPWCYLAEVRLRRGIAESAAGIAVDLTWSAFELNPQMPADGMTRKDYRSRKFGWERSKAMDAQLEILGQAEGVHFNFARISRAPSTRLAHRLHVFAERSGHATDYATRIFEAYFERGEDIGSRDVLMNIAGGMGLDVVEAERFLAAGGGLDDVVEAEKRAAVLGIRGVPYMEIGALAISGAQDASILK